MARLHKPRFTDPNTPPPGEIVLSYGAGLQVTDGPTLELDFGTGHDQAARGDAAGGAGGVSATTVILRDGSQAMQADLSLGANRITNLAAPSAASDAARLDTVTNAIGALGVSARRWPAAADTLLLWECGGTSGDLANTGSLDAAGNLTPDVDLERNVLAQRGTIGRGVRCNGTSTSKASGAAGCKPTTGTAVTVWCVFAVNVSDASKRTLLSRDYHSPGSWGAPWICAMLSVQNGTIKAEINVGGGYQWTGYGLLPQQGVEHFIGLTYDGTSLILYADGVAVSTASLPGVIDWGDPDALWHLSSNDGGSEHFSGDIFRAGVENVAWTPNDWLERWQKINGNWQG